ncbi:MAG TPA: M1 family metallopeptidase [Rhodothermales bacterium]
MPIIPLLLYAAALLAPAPAQFDGPRPGVDVVRYEFHLKLSDHSNIVDGMAKVTVRFTDQPDALYLDLVSRKPGDVGMEVASVTMNDVPIRFEHEADKLWIHLTDDRVDSVATFGIVYRGVPADGLIISQNRFGDRTFFADNWPNRARHWIPTVDHPADKALVDFVVTAPDQYQVVSNGRLVEETDAPPGLRVTHWSTTQVLPTKIMVIGVARFAVQHLGRIEGVPLETWVYPQARVEGLHDFAVAEPVLRYFIDVLGPFPFSRLANVQSTTRYGGMENAGAIFYDENSVTGTRKQESTVAHEIAHQWFGDSASEEDWHDVWLSEGFATYLAHLYFEHYYGSLRLSERMAADRKKIIAFAEANPTSSVVDTTITDPNRVLNANSYEKGGWTLHMLRAMLGDEVFWEALNTYYDRYQFGNATTADFRDVVESVSGIDLNWFFEQWIYRPGVPEFDVAWQYEAGTGEVVVDVRQRQPLAYRLTLELAVETGSQKVLRSINVSERQQSVRIRVPGEPTAIHFDPNVKLLALIEAR